MNPKSASALVWLAVIVDFLGLIVISPSAQFMFAGVAAVVAIIPAMFARKGPQIAALVVLVLSAALAAAKYSGHSAAMAQYESRATAKPGAVQAPPAQEQKK